MFVEMAGSPARATDDLNAALVRDDWSEAIRCLHKLLVSTKSAVARKNSVKSEAKALADWWDRMEVDPLKLFNLSLLIEYVFTPPGARLNTSASRKAALKTLLPHLKPQGDPRSIDEKRRAEAFAKRYISFKDTIEKPPAALKPLLHKVRLDMRNLLAELSAK